MKILCIDGREEFISIKLRNFCKKKGIVFKYAVSDIYKKNGIAEKGQQIIIIIKDFLLLDSGLLLDFWAKAIDTANYLQNKLLTKNQRGKLILKEV